MVSAAAAAAVRLLVCLPVRLPVSVCVTVATATAATAADPHWMLRALATNGASNLCSCPAGGAPCWQLQQLTLQRFGELLVSFYKVEHRNTHVNVLYETYG